jgi:hypothetical protein
MLRKLLYISVVFVALALLVPNAVFASHGHEFPEDWQNPCDVIHCEEESTGGSADESAHESTTDESATDESSEESTDESTDIRERQKRK